jgi:prepilin-type N-terminal cleavage/methylation domain-containing protein
MNHKQRGFTLIELMLAMGGIAFLLLFVVFAIVHTTNLYSKGVATRQINQVGRQVTDEISRAVRYGNEPVVRTAENRLCAGNVAYIWNNATSPGVNLYTDDTPVTFVRVEDVALCQNVTQKVDKTKAVELLGNIATVQEITVRQPVNISPIYEFTAIFSTAGDNAPTFISPGVYECSPAFGQYCAFGEFSTMIYGRR